MIFFDLETIGFSGVPVLLQYARDAGSVELVDLFTTPVYELLELLYTFGSEPVCGFNLAFDWFHIQKFRNMLDAYVERFDETDILLDNINGFASVEDVARDGKCFKPVAALDLMLHARKTEFQSTMDRKDIRIRRVPKQLAIRLIDELDKRIPLPDILFARAKNPVRWRLLEIRNPITGRNDNDFVDIVLKFAPSTSLKAIVKHLGLRDDRIMFDEVAPPSSPMEFAWAPVASLFTGPEKHWVYKYKDKQGTFWPTHAKIHVKHWQDDPYAREYAEQDVIDLQLLYKHFKCPEPGDTDSNLACMVGSVRWKGFKIDIGKLSKLRDVEEVKIKRAPHAPRNVYRWLSEVLTENEQKAVCDRHGQPSTKKAVLLKLREWSKDCSCVKFVTSYEEYFEEGFGGQTKVFKEIKTPIIDQSCPLCKGSGKIEHPVAVRAKLVLEGRQAATRRALYNKLIKAGRLHPSATVIGSLSGRMSGRTEVSGGRRVSALNALGIQHDYETRSAFPMAFEGMVLDGGDFEGYEVAIADADYDDVDLRSQLLTCNACKTVRSIAEYRSDKCNCGAVEQFRKIHGLFGMELKPGLSYDDVVATKKTAEDLYDMGKRGFFSQVYGGDENTLVERLGIPIERAKSASEGFKRRYKGVGRAHERVHEAHCSMRQPNGLGSKVYWHDPADKVESLNGFVRWFTLENKITRELFLLSEKMPIEWTKIPVTVTRRDRSQQIGNAIRSALLGCAFQIQAQCMRAALNHRIQATGAVMTKELQAELWDVQPSGYFDWEILLLNVHDELITPTQPRNSSRIEGIVNNFVDRNSSLVPLLKMKWQRNMLSWGEK